MEQGLLCVFLLLSVGGNESLPPTQYPKNTSRFDKVEIGKGVAGETLTRTGIKDLI